MSEVKSWAEQHKALEEQRADRGLTRMVKVSSVADDMTARETIRRDGIELDVPNGYIFLTREQWQAFRNEVDTFYFREGQEG